MVTADATRYTSSSEYSGRTRAVNTLQVHHGTIFSLDSLISLMMPGGRQVSANFALGADGTLVEVVPVAYRAFTSASSFDHQSYTVETVNISGAPEWGISDASHRRLGKLLAEMYREGLVEGIFYGIGGLLAHYDVPGTYATACWGPSMDADLILKYAREYLTPVVRPTVPEEDDMKYIWNGIAAPDPKARYALLDPRLNDGYVLGKTQIEADAISGNASNPSGHGRTDAQFDAALQLAKAARASYLAGQAGDVTVVPDNRDLIAAINAGFAALGAKVDLLPAEIDRFADGRKQSS